MVVLRMSYMASDLPVPWHEDLLGPSKRLIGQKANHTEDNDPNENLFNIEGLLCGQDHVAEALARSDHLGGDYDYQTDAHAYADAGVNLRQCRVNCDGSK